MEMENEYATEREYALMEAAAALDFQRLLSFVPGGKVVYVMTQDIFLRAIVEPGKISRVAEYSINGRLDGICSVYRGSKVFVVNEAVNSMFRPAILGFNIDGVDYHQLNEGDFVISDEVSDVPHIFSKLSGEHPMFHDTGLTVREQLDPVRGDRVTFADRICAMQEQIEREVSPLWRMEYEPHWDSPVIRPASWNEVVRYRPNGEYEWLPQPYPWQPQLDVDEFERQLKEVSAMAQQMLDGKKPKRKKKTSHVKDWDERLTPEDTKELDEFLDGLVQKRNTGVGDTSAN